MLLSLALSEINMLGEGVLHYVEALLVCMCGMPYHTVCGKGVAVFYGGWRLNGNKSFSFMCGADSHYCLP